MVDLSILIPSRNEMFLARTIQDILENIEGDTEVIVVLDGEWADPPLVQHPKVTIIHHPISIGQRAATNEAARTSTAKYLMKVDAHCAFDKGFDMKMMVDMREDWTVAPLMRNLHAFDWVCKKCGDRRYQSPTPTSCPKCDNKTEFERDVVWIAKKSPQSVSFCFDAEPHFNYFGEFSKRPEGQGELTESMSLQGSCFMMTRDKYFELGICDEAFGSWGSLGIEVACKTWLSGGKVMVNHKTWYAHMFRTQGGDFGFPYHLSGNQINGAKKYAKDLFFNNKWDKQIRPLSWLVERFWPVPGWTEEDLNKVRGDIAKPITKGVIYYTDNRLDPKIMIACQKQLLKSTDGKRIVSVSLKPTEFGENIVLPLERGYLTMFKQILTGLEALDTDVVFFCEHDVLYHSSHFDFTPPKKDVYYYNENVYKIRMSDGHGLHYDCQQLSGLCAYRELLMGHYRKRIELVEANGFTRAMGFEPGTHNREERIDDYKAESWKSEWPIIDLRHDNNLTPSRWNKEEFRNQRYTEGWIENDNVPGWGHLWHFWKRI
jgi:glycosyltransferase involved in cell wall biosynthesis